MEQTSILVLTINVNGYMPYEDRQAILRNGIEELNPDIIAFQEAAYPQLRSNWSDRHRRAPHRRGRQSQTPD